MPQLTAVQEGFSAGELSQAMRGQYNNALYYRSTSRQENFISMAQGPAYFRPGTERQMQTRGGEEAFFIPFIFSEDDAFVLEFTNLKMRVHSATGIVYSTSIVITDITEQAETLITSNAHGYSNDDSIHFQGLSGDFAFLVGPTYRVSNVTANTFKITDEDGNYIDSAGLTYVADFPNHRANKILEVVTPYVSYNDLRAIKYAQVGNVMYLAHPSYRPQKLTRVSATSWTMANHATVGVTFSTANNYPAAVALYENRLFYAGTNTNPQTVWGSEANDFDEFTAGTAATDAFSFRVVSNTSNRIHWMLGNERFLTLGTLGGNRKLYGATEEQAITPTSVNNRSLDSIGSSTTIPVVKDRRLIFAQQGRRRVRALEFEFATEGYEPLDLNILSEDINSEGVIQMAVQEGPPDILWVVQDDGNLAACTINFRENIYGWHRHNTLGNFKSLAVIPRPDAGGLLFLCCEREVNGEMRHFVEIMKDRPAFPVFEDFFTGDQVQDAMDFEDAMFEAQKRYCFLDCASTYDGSILPNGNAPILTLSAVTGEGVTVTADADAFEAGDVGREIWGYGRGRGTIVGFTSATEVEIDVTSDFPSTTLEQELWYLTTDSITGLADYEGQTVQVMTDGGEHPDVEVTNGAITLDWQASVAHVGYKYRGVLRTMDLEAQGLNGPLATRTKIVNRLGVRVINTLGMKCGTDPYRMEEVRTRMANSVGVRPTLPFTGDISIPLPDSHGRSKQVMIVQDKPLPCTVQLIVPDVYAGMG